MNLSLVCKFFLKSTIFLFLSLPVLVFAASGTIDNTNKFARFLDSTLGVINFKPANGNVVITDTNVTGYIWGNYVGWINLAPTGCGSTCGIKNDGKGNLSGMAWGESIGWVNFKMSNTQVKIDANGNFSGYAWSENNGWIVLSCGTDSSCGTFSHSVSTDWRPVVCNNNLDDDNDSKIDYPTDPGCTSLADTDETDSSGVAALFFVAPPAPPATPPAAPAESPETPPAPPATHPTQPETPPTLPIIAVVGTTVSSGGSTFIPSFLSLSPKFVNSIASGVEIFKETTAGKVIVNTTKKVQVVRSDAKIILQIPEVETTTDTIVKAGVVAGSLTALVPVIVAPALGLSEFLLLPIRIWGLLMSTLGIRRRKHGSWGSVYDSVTKQPIDPAYVVLQTADGKDAKTAITDLDGRYGFFTNSGQYRIVANKTNYSFPSARLLGKKSDELYDNLYFGEPIVLGENETVLARDIPMDPQGFDWNEYTKRAQNLMGFYSRNTILIERLSRFFFQAGFFAIVIIFLIKPEMITFIVLIFYGIIIIIRKLGTGDRKHGVVIEKETGLPASFSFIRILNPDTGIEIRKCVADVLGRYYCLVAKGIYTVLVTRRLEDGTYSPTNFSRTVDASNGLICEKLEI